MSQISPLDLSPSRQLSFFHCTRINLQDTDENVEEKDSPSVDRTIQVTSEEMLEKILRLDPESRSVSGAVEVADGDGDEDDEDYPDEINSMDIFLKLFLECDPIFRQIFLSQASKCQLSLPLIVTDPRTSDPTLFSLSYHPIFSQSYRTADQTTQILHIFTYKLYYISFIRIGKCMSSYKSKTLNSLLGISNCFFHKETKGNSSPKVHFSGLVEINWYLPTNSEKKRQSFHEPLLFLNLRGNALEFKKQFDFILDISTLVYVFVSIGEESEDVLKELETILETLKHKICLVIMDPSNKTAMKRFRPLTMSEDRPWYFISKYGNFANLPDYISVSLNGILNKFPDLPKMSLDTCKEVALKHQIAVDENTEVAKLTIPFQEKIDELFRNLFQEKQELTDNLYLVKSIILPLQLDQWVKWAGADRDRYHLNGDYKVSIEKREAQRTKLRGTLNSARHDQISYLIDLEGPSEFILTILRTISVHKDNVENNMVYLWRILQTCLDRLSLGCLYPFKRLAVNTCDTMETSVKQDELRIKGCNTLGIEHVMRELGQVYESFLCAKLKRTEIIERLDFDPSDLPLFAAKLILSGHSFEILDGYVTHIPSSWVSSVLRELNNAVGEDKLIFVMGILGIQSSGKSTLLNTMFGLQFPVKAGRCTRGIFMQMVAVDMSIRGTFGYDYLVVLDTEGLGSLEVCDTLTVSHDNELATFVVGMSDLVIVNLFGENQSEFKDILQITVMALMKMQLTSVKPKCIFVHQNVTDISADANLMAGKEQLIRLLDDTTRLAGQLQGFPNYNKFADVIDYDMHLDTYYIPGLYSTNPPMSTVSSDYSRECKYLKQKITQQYCTNIHFQSVSAWSQKLKDIWSSLLSQNFIMNYKNILECCAAFEMDEKLNQWTVAFDAATLEQFNVTKNYISIANSEEVHSVYNVNKTFIVNSCKKAVDDYDEEKIVEFLLQKSEYKESHKEREMKVRHDFDSARCQKRDEILESVEIHYKMRCDTLLIESKFDQISGAILEKAKAEIIRHNAKDDWDKPYPQLENLFEKQWSEWDSTLNMNHESFTADIDTDLQNIFRNNSTLQKLEIPNESIEILIGNSDKFAGIRQLNFQVGSNHYKVYIPSKHQFIIPNCAFADFHDYVQHHATRNPVDTHDLLQKRIDKFIHIVSSLCDEYLFSLNKYSPYSFHYFYHLINIVCSQVEEFNEKETSDITQQILLTPLFAYEFSFYTCCKAATCFKMLQKDFISDMNTSQLSHLKMNLKPIFIQLCQGTQMECSCAKALGEIVFVKMLNFLESQLRTDIIHYFQNDPRNHDTFRRRSSVQLKVLRDLASKKDFSQYIAYIDDPINFVRNWIEVQFKSYCNDNEVHKEIKSNSIDTNINKLKQSYIDALRASIIESKSEWKTIFYERIKLYSKDLRKSDLDILDVYQNPLNDESDFVEFFTNSFDTMNSRFGWPAWMNTTISDAVYTNTRYLTKILINCQSLCPFCKEPCLMSSKGHQHYCGSLHRPKGLVGYFHEVSKTFSIRECTHSMTTDHVIVYDNKSYKYTDYAQINPHFASWKILGEDAANSCYWQWVFYTFRYQFIEHYDYANNPEVDSWSDLTEENVLTQLDTLYEKFSKRIGRAYH